MYSSRAILTSIWMMTKQLMNFIKMALNVYARSQNKTCWGRQVQYFRDIANVGATSAGQL